MDNSTIAAVATAPGQGGIGVVRISGPLAPLIAAEVTGRELPPRQATFCAFRDTDHTVLDRGIAICFEPPHSYTGESVVELQGHGGPAILDVLLRRVVDAGARTARAGEFTERAFLNGKLDLAQAEAVADLIASGSEAAARAAVRSLEGALSGRVATLTEHLTGLRVYVEAALDFAEEEIDFLSSQELQQRADALQQDLAQVMTLAEQGRVLQEGLTVVLAGRPNAGKSSLLNRLTDTDTAIVTDTPGTTRDLLSATIQLDGLALTLLDTAGLRESRDQIEQEGIRRALDAVQRASRVLLVCDVTRLDAELARQWLSAYSHGQLASRLRSWANTELSVAQPASPIDQSTRATVPIDIVLNKLDLLSVEEQQLWLRLGQLTGTVAEPDRVSGEPGNAMQPAMLPAADQPASPERPTAVSPDGAMAGAVYLLSATRGDGLAELRCGLHAAAGIEDAAELFIARARHLHALERAAAAVDAGLQHLSHAGMPELAAEDFRVAQDALGEITGTVTSDDLLGRIFAGFCIGK